MLTSYLRMALHQARYEILSDDGSYYGEIPGFDGMYADASTLEACREELAEVLEQWLFLRTHRRLLIPVADHIEPRIEVVQ